MSCGVRRRYCFGIRAAVVLHAVCAAAIGIQEARADGQVAQAGDREAAGENRPAVSAETYRRMAEEIEQHLRRQVLEKWFPRCVDRQHGGFLPNFREDWSPGTANDKTIVFQARQTWVTAEVAKRFPDLRKEYLDYARHGLDFLERVMWDAQHGGFFWGLDPTGKITPRYGGEKHVYGIAFGIYAAANAYEATGERRALELAQRTFAWLERHAHDKTNGGYLEALTREGRPILQPPAPNKTHDAIGTVYGYKSMNSHIHLLEAVTALYRVWPDPLVEKRLRELVEVITKKVYVEPGCLNQFFTVDWRAIPEHDSFGHDVETAFLLVEAAAALKRPDDPDIWRVARSLVDHALRYGWDDRHGGFYDRGVAFGPACGKEKVWWTQAEGLNALLLMHYRFERAASASAASHQPEGLTAETSRAATAVGPATPDAATAAQQSAPQGQRLVYWNAFLKQWDWIIRYQLDAKHGEWFAVVSHDGVAPPNQAKGQVWKAAYHNGRALMHCAEMLKELAGKHSK